MLIVMLLKWTEALPTSKVEIIKPVSGPSQKYIYCCHFKISGMPHGFDH